MHNGHLKKSKIKIITIIIIRGGQRSVYFHVEVCHCSIIRKVLNKEDLGAAESCLFQSGGVGLLFSREAGQNSTREVCNYLEFLWTFFEREEEVVYDL